MLEALEDRQLPSSTGVISSITAANNQTYAFTVGATGQIFYAHNSSWHSLGGASTGGATFRQVSAGLQDGNPVCYAIQNGTGNLWEFSPSFNLFNSFPASLWDSGPHNYAVNLGGVCLQISATRNGECYAIGTDHNVWVNNSAGSWPIYLQVWDGAVQISAGVDRWGQDQVYVLNTDGYVYLWCNSGSGWLADSNGYLRANQISAGIGNNTSGTDLWYLGLSNQLAHFDGATSSWFCQTGIQISAGLDPSGNSECYIIGSADNALYTAHVGSYVPTYDGGWMTQISGAQNDMVFVVGGSDQIWGFDPNNNWAWNWEGAVSSGNWHYSYGISANPNS
jgi:hypothetical protein